MRSKKELDLVTAHRSWKKFKDSADGMESANWTLVQRCLDGVASEEEYCSLDGDYASYGPDGLTIVGPRRGPMTIPLSKEARARFGEMVYGSELEE